MKGIGLRFFSILTFTGWIVYGYTTSFMNVNDSNHPKRYKKFKKSYLKIKLTVFIIHIS